MKAKLLTVLMGLFLFVGHSALAQEGSDKRGEGSSAKNKGMAGCCAVKAKDGKSSCPAKEKSLRLCASCGDIKGSKACCKPGAKCGKCGLHKGTPGCCKINDKVKAANPELKLCTKCGEIGKSEKCCKPAPKCNKCNKHKGAPGCCKKP